MTDKEPRLNWTDEPYKTVTICGSSRFKPLINAINQQLTMQGYIVVSLGAFGHWDFPDYNWSDQNELKAMLDELHRRKIAMTEVTYVVNPWNYIGISTQREIEYALNLGKKVIYHEDWAKYPEQLLHPNEEPWWNSTNPPYSLDPFHSSDIPYWQFYEQLGIKRPEKSIP